MIIIVWGELTRDIACVKYGLLVLLDYAQLFETRNLASNYLGYYYSSSDIYIYIYIYIIYTYLI